jgi:hypothetical protein
MAHSPERAQLDDRLFIACCLSWAAAIIHVKAALDHVDQSVLETVLFDLTACAQFLWGIAVYRGAGRDLLIAGALGSVAVAAVWVVSRTAGLPIGPTPGQPEAVGLIDTVASCDEVLLAALVGLHLVEEQSRRALTATALVLLLLSSLLMLGPHVH